MTKLTGKTTGNILKIEDVKENVDYAMTIAPSDDHQYWNEEDRIEKFERYYKLYMISRLLPNTFSFNMEISPTGRLHFHGSIRFKNQKSILKFYLNDIRFLTLHNQIELDTITDNKVWSDYCHKQEIHKLPIVCNQDYDRLPSKIRVNMHKPITDY